MNQIICSSACTVTIDFAFPPFNIDESGGGAIALAIIGVWALGWAVRVCIRMLSEAGGSSHSESVD